MIAILQANGVELAAKMTIVLAAFWIVHIALARSNPRWQVGLWRIATLALLILFVADWSPPFYRLRILNKSVSSVQGNINDSEPRMRYHVRDDRSISVASAATSDSRPAGIIEQVSEKQLTSEVVHAASPSVQPETVAAGQASSERTKALVTDAKNWLFSRIDWRTSAFVLYAAVTTGLLLRLALGLLFTLRLVRTATEALPYLQTIAAELARELSCGALSIRLTDRFQTPVLIGLIVPRIVLLPRAMLESPLNEQDTRGAIAHELAHAAGNDMVWDFLIAAIASVLWPHPLAWRMRRAHRAACERVCDRLAADCLGDKGAYKGVLARAALRISGTTASIGLAMTRRADVRDRLAALDFDCDTRRLGFQAWAIAATVLFAVITLGVGSLAVKSAQGATAGVDGTPAADVVIPQDADKAKATDATAEKPVRPESLQFNVTRGEDDRPVAGATVTVHMYDAKPNVNQELTTDEKGIATFSYPEGSEPVFLWAMVHQPGLVPYYVNFGRNLVPAALPTKKAIRMEPGKKVGGTIVDPSGNPVAGATLSILVPAKDSPTDMHYHLLYDETDASGNWELDGAPRTFSGLSLRIEHPKFMKSWLPVEDRVDGRYVLDPGLSLRGKVTDASGNPISTAHITVGRDRWGSIDKPVSVADDGTYEVPGLKVQNTYVTAEARGFAPQVLQLTIDKNTAQVNFALQAGQTTQFKFVNEAGEPVSGAWIVADTWKGCRSLWWRDTSDAAGLVSWSGAPTEPVTYHLGGGGYSVMRDVVVQPRDEPHVITLHRPLKVQGTVTDWQGNKPSEFRVSIGRKLSGRKDIHWSSNEGSIGRNGTFAIEYNENCDEVFVRVEAPGFKPWVSDAIPFTKANHQANVRLQPTNALAGIISSPDGTPAANAQLTLLTESQGMQFTSGYSPLGGKQTVTSDINGRFDFLPVDDAFLIAAVHDSGYAEVTGDELRNIGGIRLQAWAKVEVTVRRGDMPMAAAKVAIDPKLHLQRRQVVSVFSYGISGVTNADGRVTFDRVVPREAMIMKTIEQAVGSGTTVYPERSVRSSLSPGQTTTVEIGGGGATVTGRLTVTGKAPAEHRWSLNEAVSIENERDERSSATDSTSSRHFYSLINDDGSFTANDIPPGRYVLRVRLTAVPEPNVCGHGTVLGQISREFEVTTDLRPIDLGTIEGTWIQRLGVGKQAPLFVAEGIGRDNVRLAELRGRVVVIDFWATWCAPCMAEMPQLAELYKEFSSDQRFALLGLSLDHTLREAESAVKKNGWPWVLAFGGPGLNATIPARFEVQAIPEKFVIDIDGKILYRGRDLADVAKLVKNRLSELPATTDRRENEIGIKPVESADDFRGVEPIAVALVANNIQYRTGVAPSLKGPGILTWSQAGKPCREMADIGTSAWLSGPQRLAIDPRRERLYFCDTFHKQLLAFDRTGRKRFASDVPDVHAAAVDEPTGDIWCLTANHLNSGELVILDETGREKVRHPIAAFGIAYSPTEDAFWLAGNAILKVNRDGKVLSRYPLDEGRYSFTDVAIDRQRGGGWILELDHPDQPRSKRQLWRISPSGAPSVVHEFPEPILPRTLACVDGAPWLAAMMNYSRSVSNERQWALQQFNVAGKPLTVLPLSARDITVGLTTGSLWAVMENQLCQIDAEGNRLQTISLPVDLESMQIAAF